MSKYGDKAAYVKSLNEFLAPMEDFESIKYVHTNTDAEYIRITDILGGKMFLDVTGYTLGEILNSVAQVILVRVPADRMNLQAVADVAELRRVAPLFR